MFILMGAGGTLVVVTVILIIVCIVRKCRSKRVAPEGTITAEYLKALSLMSDTNALNRKKSTLTEEETKPPLSVDDNEKPTLSGDARKTVPFAH